MPPKKEGLYDKLYKAIDVDQNKMSVKLTQMQRGNNKSKFNVFTENTICQADLIYMPEDQGYNYILTVVDLGSRIVDAEPLEDRKARDVVEGFQTIFKRKRISAKIKYLYTDPGSEFKNNEFHEFMMEEYGITVRHTMTARKNQMGVVEAYNYIFTKALGTRMTAEELENCRECKEWVESLPKLVTVLNDRDGKERHVSKIQDFFKMPKFEKGDAKKMLQEGQYVHYALQQPKDVLTGQKLASGFRNGDQRYSSEVKRIEQVSILPNQPPRYILYGMNNVSFLRHELLPADEKEVETETKKQSETDSKAKKEKEKQQQEITQHEERGGKEISLRNRRVLVEEKLEPKGMRPKTAPDARYPKMVVN
jgi:hypothetical protein